MRYLHEERNWGPVAKFGMDEKAVREYRELGKSSRKIKAAWIRTCELVEACLKKGWGPEDV